MAWLHNLKGKLIDGTCVRVRASGRLHRRRFVVTQSVGGREGGSVVCGAPNPLKKGSSGKREREGVSAKRKKVDERWMTS